MKFVVEQAQTLWKPEPETRKQPFLEFEIIDQSAAVFCPRLALSGAPGTHWIEGVFLINSMIHLIKDLQGSV